MRDSGGRRDRRELGGLRTRQRSLRKIRRRLARGNHAQLPRLSRTGSQLLGRYHAMAPKVILTGFMATGKSVVSRALAKRLGWPLVDCDAILEQRAGKPISIIFSENGETHFRDLDPHLIREITPNPPPCP